MDKLDKGAVPYLLVTRKVPFKFGEEEVKVCLCLLDPLCMGVGITHEDAIRCMVDQLDEKYDDNGKLK